MALSFKCQHCNSIYYRKPSRKGITRFCSRQCKCQHPKSAHVLEKMRLASLGKKGNKASNWQGGRIERDGYIYIKTEFHPLGGKQGYVAEHRLVMEKKIGRYLERKEVVHHINHNRKDNRPENLELCESAGKHTLLHHPEVMEKARLANLGIRRSPKTEFKKGFTPWNKKVSRG